MEYLQLTHNDVLAALPERDLFAHKGDFGKILLLCGSKGYTGAATLAAMGALRSGAGLVYLGVPPCIYAIEAVKLTEAIVFPLDDSNGMLSSKAAEELPQRVKGMDAVLIGPGLGQSSGTLAVLEAVLKNADVPVVVDADGINLLAEHKLMLRGRHAPTVLTPHEGEFRRLGGKLELGRTTAAMDMAQNIGAIVVLKGHETLITDGDLCYQNQTGNPGMAVGGSGDILAGMITSLIGQGIEPLLASACAVWLHGRAGDVCAETIGQYGMLPTDMLQVLPRLMK